MSSRDFEELRYERAAGLLEEFLATYVTPTADALDGLCAANPSVAAEIRELNDLCLSLGSTRRSEDMSSVIEKALSDAFLMRHGDSAAFRRRYSIEGMIAEGGMGTILAAYDEDMHRKIAIKVIRRQTRPTREGVTPPARPAEVVRFVREAGIAGMLDHPSVVPVHEVGVDPEGRPYFTMKRVEGRTLRDLLRDGAAGRSPSEMLTLLRIVVRVCEALAHAHERDVIHRDVKPANVMVGELGQVYLMDWGLAKRCDSRATHVATRMEPMDSITNSSSDFHTLDGRVLGTPSYMSPEQALGTPAAIGPGTDIYSVGTVLYHVIAGHAPYCEGEATPTHTRILERLIQGPPNVAALESGAPELRAICLRAMDRDPARRYPTIRALLGDVEAYISGHVVAAHAAGGWTRAKKWVKRNAALTSSLAALLLATMAGLGFAMYLAASETTARRRADTALAELMQRYEDVQELTRRMLFDLDDELVGLPGTLRAREALVGTAMEYVEVLLAHDPDNLTVLRHAANGHIRMGRVQQNLGDIVAAEAQLHQGSRILADLISRRPSSEATEDLQLAVDLAGQEVLLGELFMVQARFEAALECYTCANEVLGMAHRADSSNVGVTIDYALTFGRKGDALDRLGRSQQGVPDVEFGIEVLEQLKHGKTLEVARASRQEALLHIQLANIRREVGDTAKSLSSLSRAAVLLDSSCDPREDSYQLDKALGLAWNSMALTASVSGPWPVAEHAFESAHGIFDSLSCSSPDDTWHRRQLGSNLISWASGLLSRGEVNSALYMSCQARAELAVLCTLDPANRQWRQDFARVELLIGDALRLAEPLRAEQQLERANELLDSLVSEEGSDSEARGPLAESHLLLAAVRPQSSDLALEHGEKALVLRQAILDEDPSNAVSRNNLVTCLHYLGSSWLARGRADKALVYCRTATEMAFALVEEQPRHMVFLKNLASCEIYLGDAYCRLAQWDLANKAYSNGLTHYLELQVGDPSNEHFLERVAVAHMVLGDTFAEMGQLEHATREYQASLGSSSIGVGAHPHRSEWLRLQAKASNVLGGVLMRQGMIEAAEGAYRRHRDNSFAIATQHPTNLDFTWAVTASHRNFADLHLARGETTSAVDESRLHVEGCQRLCDAEPGSPIQQQRLGIALRKLGEALRAHSQWPEALELLRQSAVTLEDTVSRSPRDHAVRRALISTLEVEETLLRTVGMREAAEAARKRVDELRAPP